MNLTLKSAWVNTQKLSPAAVGNEFINIKTSWQNQDTGATPVSRINSIGSVTFPVRTITAAYTLGDNDYLLLANTTSAFTVTLPSAATVKGRQYVVMTTGVKILTIATTSGQTINGGTSLFVPGLYFHVQLFSDGSNWVAI